MSYEEDDGDEERRPPGPIAKGRGAGKVEAPAWDQVPEILLEIVLQLLSCRRDRNAVSLVCRSWYRAEALTRRDLFVGHLYAVCPARATSRFPAVRALCLKGFADIISVPHDWGVVFSPWAAALAGAWPASLERLALKRVSVSDDDLALLAGSLPAFRDLTLVRCDGFGSAGLAALAEHCKRLCVLELIQSDMKEEDEPVDWMSRFPPTPTALESLSFEFLRTAVNFDALEALVARSPALRRLRVNDHVSVSQLRRLMWRAPQLTHLHTGPFNSPDVELEVRELEQAFGASQSLVCLSGLWALDRELLPGIYPACTNLTSLDLSYADVTKYELKPIICLCHKLQTFWVLDLVGDEGLQAVAATCKDLCELRVFPVNEDCEVCVSGVGLLAISEGCHKLRSILYHCRRMTNAAVVAMSRNCPDLMTFRLYIIDSPRLDHVTGAPMDEGVGAIVMNCKKLTRLAVSGLLTDRAFEYIGKYGKSLRMLSVAFAGDSDVGLQYVLEGCPRLQKLDISHSPFGDAGLLSGIHHFCNLRFLLMSSCKLTLRGCMEVARRLPRLVVEVTGDWPPHGADYEMPVKNLYMYRSVAGPRDNAPPFVKIL